MSRFPAIGCTEGSALISHAIDGTENNFYAVPFGLTRDDDPITLRRAARRARRDRTADETLENVPVQSRDRQEPNYLENPVRNNADDPVAEAGCCSERERPGADLRRSPTGGCQRLGARAHGEHQPGLLAGGDAAEHGDPTVAPPESGAVHPRADVRRGGADGRGHRRHRPGPTWSISPIRSSSGLEDENANLLYHVLQQLSWGGMPQQYYAFNTGGVGADSNEEASGSRYLKIPRELTMLLQEALLRNAVKFEYDGVLRSEVAVAVMDSDGNEVLDLREKWLPINIYGEDDYAGRVRELMHRRYYGRDQQDKAGILRYTKVVNTVLDITDVPAPADERELSWLLSFYWSLDQAYETLAETAAHRSEGMRPVAYQLNELQRKYRDGLQAGLSVDVADRLRLAELGLRAE